MKAQKIFDSLFKTAQELEKMGMRDEAEGMRKNLRGLMALYNESLETRTFVTVIESDYVQTVAK